MPGTDMAWVMRMANRNRIRVVSSKMSMAVVKLGAMMRLQKPRRAVLATVSIGAILAVAWPAANEAMAPKSVIRSAVRADSFVESDYAAGAIDARQAEGAPAGREQRALAAFIARRYRLAGEAAAPIVASAYRAGEESAVDPLLILAVIAIESSFNPLAESVLGAKGLMQVMAKFHMEKIALHGGKDVLLDPEANIRIGAQILREYLRRFGEIEDALQMYAGAADDPDTAYARKVLAERSRIEQVLLRLRRAA